MDLILKRREYREDGVTSDLCDSNGKVLFRTIEHSYGLKAKLKAGKYTCVRGMHKLADGKPFETFEITGVKGHWGILFHAGNWEKDSSGCVLVGKAFANSPQGRMVTQSRKALAELLALLSGVDTFQLTVLE